MKILVIGGGGREHAIIQKLREDPRAETIYALPGNGGIAADAICLGGSATDIPGALAAAKQYAVDFVVVAPDDPKASPASAPAKMPPSSREAKPSPRTS